MAEKDSVSSNQASATKVSFLSITSSNPQPSEFVIFIAKDTENVSQPEVNANPRADNFWFARYPPTIS